jgi:hypothetical protein
MATLAKIVIVTPPDEFTLDRIWKKVEALYEEFKKQFPGKRLSIVQSGPSNPHLQETMKRQNCLVLLGLRGEKSSINAWFRQIKRYLELHH